MPDIENVEVGLGTRSYSILIGEGLIADAARHIAPMLRRSFAAIVTDENVARVHLQPLQASLHAGGIETTAIVIPPGEKSKSFAQLAELSDALLEAGVERRDKIIALGGGVIGDLTGFAAAILRRGTGLIQIPTSLLAQVDSSVGGKTGINSKHGKNLIGAFKQPDLVLADLSALATLPKRELAAGYSEIAKYGLLGDAGFFEWLEANAPLLLRGDAQARRYAIRRSCEAKAQIVAEDETELGARALLNLGHTFGHALEAATGYSARLLHGEAVAIGMVQAFRFSETLAACPKGTADRVLHHLKAAGLPVHVSEINDFAATPAELLKLMHQDKKAQSGELTFILAKGIGRAFIAKAVPREKVLAFLEKDLKRP